MQSIAINNSLNVYTTGEEYEGTYSVTPSLLQQTLPTEDKLMSENVVISAMTQGSVTPSASISSTVVGDGSYVHGSYDVELTVTPSASVSAGYVSGDASGSPITRYVKGEKKTVTPSTSSQTITPTSGKVITEIEVNAVPTGSVTPSASISSTVVGDGSYVHGSYDVELTVTPSASVSAGYVSGDASGSPITRYVKGEKKTVTPSTSSQTITPTSGKVITEIEVQPNDVYSGTYTITPSTSVQTLATNGKVMSNNVTVNAVSLTGDATEADVCSGKTFYGNDMTLRTGTGAIASEPFIEETYNANGDLISAVMHGHTVVRNSAFEGNTTLTSVTMPNTVTKIKNRAFSGDNNLLMTSLPSGITELGEYCFYMCIKIALTSLPSGLTTIPPYAFNKCTKLVLTSLPSGLTSIGVSSFSECSILALTSLPDGITSIGNYCFYNCYKLALTSLPANLTSIGHSAFTGCWRINITSLPSGITNFGGYVFEYCGDIVNIEIPCQILGPGKNIFYGCSGLQKVWFRNSCTTVTADSASYAPFAACSTSLQIYVESDSKPEGYGEYFNRTGADGATTVTVVYGQTTRPW